MSKQSNLVNSSQDITVDTSGNLGIGTTSPSGKLSVYTTARNASDGYTGQNFGIIVGTDNQDDTGDDGNGIVFTQQYAPDGVDSSQVRTGAIIGYKGQATGNFGGGLKLFVQPVGATSMSNAMTLTKDSRVGIGTSSPTRPLQVTDTTNDGSGGFKIESYLPTLEMDDISGGGTSFVLQHDGTNTLFKHDTAERMRIDSAGRVTMPYQPAWFAAGNAGWHASATSGVIPLAAVSLNRGNHYNTSGSKFTAPVSGVYHVNIMAFMDTTGQMCLKLNGSDYVPTGGDTGFMLYTNNNTGPEMASASGVIYLSAGDYIQLGARSTQSVYVYTGHSSFSGYLIG